MQNQIIEQITAATNKTCETMKSLGNINTSALGKLTDLQFDFISANMESAIEQTKSLSSKKEAKDFFSSSAEFVSDYNEKMMDFTSKTVEIFTESRDKATSLYEEVIATKAAPAKEPGKANKATTVKTAVKKSTKEEA